MKLRVASSRASVPPRRRPSYLAWLPPSYYPHVRSFVRSFTEAAEFIASKAVNRTVSQLHYDMKLKGRAARAGPGTPSFPPVLLTSDVYLH